MKKYTYIKILCACVVISISACSKQAPANNFTVLDDANCFQYASSSIKPELPDEWKAYLDSTKVCSLVKNIGDKPAVVLVSISLADATEKKSASDPWDNLPKPILFNDKGTCLARLPYLYPDDPPIELVLSYGGWLENIPGEIQVHVLNQAVDGDFDLPVLTWDKFSKQYLSIGQSIGSQKEKMRCAQ